MSTKRFCSARRVAPLPFYVIRSGRSWCNNYRYCSVMRPVGWRHSPDSKMSNSKDNNKLFEKLKQFFRLNKVASPSNLGESASQNFQASLSYRVFVVIKYHCSDAQTFFQELCASGMTTPWPTNKGKELLLGRIYKAGLKRFKN